MGGIEFVQQFSNPFLDVFFEGVTIIAEKFIMMLFVGYFYWCYNKDFGRKFMLTVMSGFPVNVFFKNIFRVDRPFVRFKDEIRTIRVQTATGYSYPSGHTQTATTVFSGVGFEIRKFFPLIGGFLIFLIGLSRVYLGVHTIYDVLGGLAFGLIWTFLSFLIYDKLSKYNNSLLYLLYIIPSVFAIISVNPQFVGDTFTMCGTSVGAVIGVVAECRFINFKRQNTKFNQLIKIAVGFAVSIILEQICKFLLGDLIKQTNALGCTLVFISYFLVGLWITAGLPLFSKLFLEKNLIKQEENKDENIN